MERSTSNESNTTVTTIGDLVAALTDIAVEGGRTEQESYLLASAVLEDIMRRNMDSSLFVH